MLTTSHLKDYKYIYKMNASFKVFLLLSLNAFMLLGGKERESRVVFNVRQTQT